MNFGQRKYVARCFIGTGFLSSLPQCCVSPRPLGHPCILDGAVGISFQGPHVGLALSVFTHFSCRKIYVFICVAFSVRSSSSSCGSSACASFVTPPPAVRTMAAILLDESIAAHGSNQWLYTSTDINPTLNCVAISVRQSSKAFQQ